MADVFLSYKTEDREIARSVVRGLEAHGLSVWWDQHIVMGDVWRGETARQLDEAGAVVVLWTHLSTGAVGRFVQEEAARAQRRGTYMPAQMDDCELPLGFSETQALQLGDWDGDPAHPQFQRLVAQIRRIETAAPHPPPQHGPKAQAAPDATAPGFAAISGASRSERRSVTLLRVEMLHQPGSLDDPEYLDESLAEIDAILAASLDPDTSLVQDLDPMHCTLLFGLPRGDEMAEVHAVETALTLKDQFKRRLDLGVRIALASGTAVVTTGSCDEKSRATSNLPVRTKALLDGASPGVVVISDSARRRLRAFFETEDLGGGSHSVLRRTAVRDRIGAAAQVGLSTLIGRDAESAEINRAIAASGQGSGQALSVIGDAGIGKSRMLHEAAAWLAEGGFLVLRADASTHGRTSAFAPFRTVMRALIPAGAEEDAGLIGEAYPALAPYSEFIQYLAALGPDRQSGIARLDGVQRNAACREAILAAITVAAESRPIALLVDDFHLADQATRDAITALASTIRHSRVFVMVAARPDAPPAWPPMAHCRQSVLAPLSAAETSILLKEVSGAQSIVTGLPEVVHKRSDGIPFFIEELGRRLLESGDFSIERGKLTTRPGFNPLDLPQSLQGLVQARLDQIDPDLRAMVQVAAVIGPQFEWSVLRDLLCLEGSPATHLAPAIEAGLIHQTRIVPEPAYRFSQQLIQHVAAGNLLTRHRRELHRRIAEGIERQCAQDCTDRAEELAFHYAEAGCDEQAVGFLLLAAEQAISWGSAQVALEMADRAARLLDQQPAEDADAKLLVRAYCILGEALHLCRGFEDATLAEVLERLETLCEPGGPGHDDLACAWLMWRCYYAALKLSQCLACAKRMARIAEKDGDPRVRMVAVFAEAVVHLFAGEYMRAADLFAEGVELSETVGRDLDGIHAIAAFYGHLFYASALVQMGRPGTAEEHFEIASALAERQRSINFVIMVGCYRQLALQTLGDIEGCARLNAAHTQLAVEHDLFHSIAFNRMIECIVLAVRGQAATAVSTVKELGAYFESDSSANGRMYQVVRMTVSFAAGDLATVRDAIGRLRRSMATVGTTQFIGHVARAELLLDWQTDRPGCEARAKEVLEVLETTGVHLVRMMLAGDLARLLAAAGEVAQARELLDGALAALDNAQMAGTPYYDLAVEQAARLHEAKRAEAG